jgi:hypothetical protein
MKVSNNKIDEPTLINKYETALTTANRITQDALNNPQSHKELLKEAEEFAMFFWLIQDELLRIIDIFELKALHITPKGWDFCRNHEIRRRNVIINRLIYCVGIPAAAYYLLEIYKFFFMC